MSEPVGLRSDEGLGGSSGEVLDDIAGVRVEGAFETGQTPVEDELMDG